MVLKFKKLNDTAVIPSYAKPGDAGLDLVATEVLELV
jgi:dUTPase